jgi:hypothetical protein
MSGISNTEVADSKSDTIAVRRRPMRSTTVPETRATSTSGKTVAAATTPAMAALPVRSSTSQGRATLVMPLPTPLTKVANSRKRMPRRRGVAGLLS